MHLTSIFDIDQFYGHFWNFLTLCLSCHPLQILELYMKIHPDIVSILTSIVYLELRYVYLGDVMFILTFIASPELVCVDSSWQYVYLDINCKLCTSMFRFIFIFFFYLDIHSIFLACMLLFVLTLCLSWHPLQIFYFYV